MIIEVYVSGGNCPPLYDAFIDKDGTLWTMEPPPPAQTEDFLQVVLERGFVTPTADQQGALNFLARMNNAKLHLFSDDFAMQL